VRVKGSVRLAAALLVLGPSVASAAGWLPVRDVEVVREESELGGALLRIDYRLEAEGITAEEPAWVFMRMSRDGGATWSGLAPGDLGGSGHGIVERAGKKTSHLWGLEALGLSGVETPLVAVRALRMAHVPGGEFHARAIPGAGYDDSRLGATVSSVGAFFMSTCETTVSMYADYLEEVGASGAGWHERMSDARRGGIVREGETGAHTYRVIAGREDHPITFVSWYDARAFLAWCGLRLPTEAQWEKAVRGGTWLDGDEAKSRRNPLPDRRYPWGDGAPDAGGVFRCNLDGPADGFAHTAPAASFPEFPSPYGLFDLAGNVAEWTRERYTTSYHAGLDGFRILRGGSWMSLPEGCDAVTGATRLPIKGSAAVGFRGVYEGE
jgi:formylglycine-generating enzyme required for sulfatase activity